MLETPATTAQSYRSLLEAPHLRKAMEWLQNLCALPQDALDQAPAISIVLDNDFGELTTLLYLVMGQPVFANTTLYLSPRVYAKNADILPGRTREWTGAAHLMGMLEQDRCELLILASGYLLPVHDLLTLKQLDQVLALAKRQAMRVATFDPFLGLVARAAGGDGEGLEQMIQLDFPTQGIPALDAAKRQASAKLVDALGGADRLLWRYPHVFPVQPTQTPQTRSAWDGRNLSCYNPCLKMPDHLSAQALDQAPFWVFVLSEVDFQRQMLMHPGGVFLDRVVDWLQMAARSERTAVFFGPSEVNAMLQAKLAGNERIILRDFAPFHEIMALLLLAEFSFYWNIVSHTILMQLMNGRPPIILDQGHLLGAVPGLQPMIRDWYYQGWQPPIGPATPPDFAQLRQAYEQAVRQQASARAGYRAAPSPQQMVDALRAGRHELAQPPQ
jgi:hypothetical protein